MDWWALIEVSWLVQVCCVQRERRVQGCGTIVGEEQGWERSADVEVIAKKSLTIICKSITLPSDIFFVLQVSLKNCGIFVSIQFEILGL